MTLKSISIQFKDNHEGIFHLSPHFVIPQPPDAADPTHEQSGLAEATHPHTHDTRLTPGQTQAIHQSRLLLSWARRRAAGRTPPGGGEGSWQPHILTQASTPTLSGQASICFPFKSTTERAPTCFLNQAGITGLWKVCETLKAYDVCVCVRVIYSCVFSIFLFFLYCCRKLESCRQAPRRKEKPHCQGTTWPSLLDTVCLMLSRQITGPHCMPRFRNSS